jgi:hypothetical protein
MTDTSPMEQIPIGLLLRETVSVALRHWVLLLLTPLALAAAFLASTVLIWRIALLGWLPTDLALVTEIMWGSYRVTSWLICGLVIQRVLAAEANAERHKRPLRGFGRCVLYLATLTVIGYLIDPIFRLIPSTLPEAGIVVVWVAFAIETVLLICIWAYLDARFALFTTSRVCGPRSEAFFASWQRTRGNRNRLFLLFLAVEAPVYLAYLAVPEPIPAIDTMFRMGQERFAGVPLSLLIFRLPGIAAFAVYLAVVHLLCAGAFVSIYRRFAAESAEARAAVFD